METTKKSTRKSNQKVSDEKIVAAYIKHLLVEGKQPVSVFKFCHDLHIEEEAFYNLVGSFDGLDRLIWKRFIDKTIARLESDRSFKDFSSREKMLAFYFTLLEELKSNRSYAIFHLGSFRKPEMTPGYLKSFKEVFESFFEKILAEGKGNGEVANRPYLDRRYPQLFWFHLGFILLFWKDDDSAAFERTDAAIEKSVNLAFDLIGKGTIDSALDFGKFVYQSKMK